MTFGDIFSEIIVTVCVFVRHLFSFYPFYFDFHSARIIFDMFENDHFQNCVYFRWFFFSAETTMHCKVTCILYKKQAHISRLFCLQVRSVTPYDSHMIGRAGVWESFSNILLFYLDVVWFGRWSEPWNFITSHFRILHSFPSRISTLF
jgi:hypothetical protein